MSVGRGVVPAAWRAAVITPVPKCTPVSGVSDLRQISVTPILSRMVERLVAKNHISPAIPPAKLNMNSASNQRAVQLPHLLILLTQYR